MKSRFAGYLVVPFIALILAANAFSDDTFNRLIREQKWAEAVRHADDNIPPANRTGQLWAGMGLAHESLNAPERALACYLVGINMDGANHDAHLGAARVYNRLNQADNALNMAQKAMEIRMSGEASWEFARASIALGRVAEAKAALERVVETDAGNVVANRELGGIYYNDKDFARALPLMKRALAGQADNELALRIAVAHRELGQIDSAIVYFNRVTASGTPSPEVFVELGRLHYGRGDHANAAENFGKANRNLLTADDLYHLALSLEAAKAEDRAILDAYSAAVAKFGNATGPNALAAREKLGRAHLSRRAFREAEAALAPLHRADPEGRTVPDILLLMAQVSEGLGNNTAAIGHLERAIARDNRNVEAYARLADLYTRAGQAARANATYERLVSLDPNNPKIHLALGNYNFGVRKFSDALSSYQRSFTLDPSTEAALGMMNSAWSLRRFSEARDAAESALHRDPNLKEPRFMLVDIHIAENNHAAARAILLELLQTEADNLELWRKLALCSEKTNDAANLANADRRIIVLDPQDIPSRLRVARGSEAAGDLKTAYEVLMQLAALQPRESEVQRSLYEISVKQNDNPAAIRHLQAFLALRPNDATAHRDLGNLQFTANDRTGALASYRAAVRADARITGMYQNYAAILMANNAPAQELMPVLTAAVAAGEANEAIFTAAGNEHQKQNNFARAAEMFQQALQLNPQNLANLSALALSHERSGKDREAILAYEQVTAMNPQATREFKALGDLYAKIGQMPQAVAAYKRFLERVPTDVAVARIVGDHEFGLQNWAEANKYYAMVSGPEASNAVYLRNFATSCFEVKNFARAGMLFKQLADANPRDPEPLKKLFEIETLNQNARGAIENLRKYVALVPNDAAMQRTLGDLLFDARDNAGALAAYRAALRLDPATKGIHKRHVELLVGSNAPPAEQITALNAAIAADEADAAMFARLGDLHRAANNCRAAIPALERAAQLDNKNTAVLSAIADCHIRGNNIAGAILVLEQVTMLNPNATAEFKQLGDLYVRQNQTAEAVAAYRKFLERGTDDAAARLVGEQAFRANNWADAVRFLGMVRGNAANTTPFLEMLGRAAFENNDNQRALTVYRQLSTANPQNADYVKMLYDLAVRMGAREEAVTHLRRYVTLRPRDAEMQKVLGDLLFERRDRPGALAAYRAALTADPQAKGFHRRLVELVDSGGTPAQRITAMEGAIAAGESDVAMIVRLGNLYLAQNQPGRAVPLFQRAVSEDAQNVQLLVELAKSQQAAGQINEAILTYERYVAMNPRASAEHKTLGDLYLRQNKNTEAMRAYKKYLETNRTDNAVALVVARAAFEANDWAEAVKYFAMIQGPDAKRPEVLKMYGTAAFEAKDNARALTVLRELAELTPRDADVIKMLEEVARRTGSGEMALNFLRQYAALRPQDAEAHRRLGDALFEAKDEPGALAAYRVVLRVSPNATGFHRNFVSLVMKHGTDAEKITALTGAITANEADVGMYAALGALHKQRNQFANAARMFEEASKLEPTNAAFLGELADCQFRAGNLDAATQNLQKALVLNPRAVTEHRTLGDIYMQQKRPDLAVEAYKKFLEGTPEGDPRIAQIVGDHAFEQRRFAEAFKYLSMVQGNAAHQHLFRLGMSAHSSGNAQAAVEALERYRVAIRGLRQPPATRNEALRTLIAAYDRAGDGEKAASLIEDFLRGPPVVRDADLAHRRGVLVDARNPDAAIRIFEQNTQTYPRDHRNFMRAGLYFARNNRNPARALTMFERTVALNDTIARAWYELGMQYGRARRDRDMTNAFQRFIALESRNPDPIMRVGEYLLVGRNMPGDALMFLEMANSLRPNHPATMVLLARCYTSVGRTEEGIRILESVVRNSRGTPVPIEVRIALAEGYLAVGKNMEAATAWKLVTDEKREVPHLVSYATALLGINRNQEALGIANEILVRDAQNIDALMILGRARAAMRNFEDAMDAYRRIGLINPNHVPALYERANVFLHQQNFDQARTLYARTLELDPKFALGELGLARVARGQRNQAEYQNRLQRAHALDPNHREIQEEVRRANQARSQ